MNNAPGDPRAKPGGAPQASVPEDCLRDGGGGRKEGPEPAGDGRDVPRFLFVAEGPAGRPKAVNS